MVTIINTLDENLDLTPIKESLNNFLNLINENFDDDEKISLKLDLQSVSKCTDGTNTLDYDFNAEVTSKKNFHYDFNDLFTVTMFDRCTYSIWCEEFGHFDEFDDEVIDNIVEELKVIYRELNNGK